MDKVKFSYTAGTRENALLRKTFAMGDRLKAELPEKDYLWFSLVSQCLQTSSMLLKVCNTHSAAEALKPMSTVRLESVTYVIILLMESEGYTKQGIEKIFSIAEQFEITRLSEEHEISMLANDEGG